MTQRTSHSTTCLDMTRPEETKSEEIRTVSPPRSKRERSEDEEPARRVVQRKLTAEESEEESGEVSEESMQKIVLEDLRKNNEMALEWALKRLRKYLFDDDDEKFARNQNAFVQVGGHLAVVRVMKEHPDCKNLQIHGLNVLIGVTYKSSWIRIAVAKVKGIEAILEAMTRFPSERDIVRRGFGALLNIVSEQANAELLVLKLGRMAILVEQMNKYRADKDITVHACVMLRNLSHFRYLSDQIVDAKAVSALASAIESHRDTPDIQKSARSAMKRLV